MPRRTTPPERQIVYPQHIWGFVGTLFLLGALIHAKPAFLADPAFNLAAPVPQGYLGSKSDAMGRGNACELELCGGIKR